MRVTPDVKWWEHSDLLQFPLAVVLATQTLLQRSGRKIHQKHIKCIWIYMRFSFKSSVTPLLHSLGDSCQHSPSCAREACRVSAWAAQPDRSQRRATNKDTKRTQRSENHHQNRSSWKLVETCRTTHTDTPLATAEVKRLKATVFVRV